MEPPKGLSSLVDAIVAYLGVAVFFTTVRAVLRQEWRGVAGLLMGYSASLVCSVGTGLFLREQKRAFITVLVGVALAALVSFDIIKVVLNFGAQAAADKRYGAQLFSMFMPKGAPAPEEPMPKDKPPTN